MLEPYLSEVGTGQIVFLILFSVPMALFYNVAFKLMFEWEKLPNWLVFVLLPSIILFVAYFFNKYTNVVSFALFIGVFISWLAGFVYLIAKEILGAYRKRRKKESASKILVAALLSTLNIVFFAVLFFGLGRYAFVALFLFVAFQMIVFPSAKSNFLRLQASLPTSKIRSMAMGLVEIRGTTKMIDPVISRLGKKECIGYRYTIDKVSRDNDGDKSYSNIFDETVFNPFIIKDDTGEVRIEAKDIDLVWLERTEVNENGKKRYSQYRVMPNQKVLLIGKANSKNNQNFIEREPIKDVFTLAPLDRLNHWNLNKPLYNSALTYGMILFAFIALILIANVEVKENALELTLPSLSESLKGFDINTLLEKAYE